MTPAVIRLGCQRKHPPGSAIEQYDIASRTGDNHGLGHAAQDCVELPSLLLERRYLLGNRIGSFEQMPLRETHWIALVRHEMRGRFVTSDRVGHARHAF